MDATDNMNSWSFGQLHAAALNCDPMAVAAGNHTHTTPQRTHTAKQKLERRYHVTTFCWGSWHCVKGVEIRKGFFAENWPQLMQRKRECQVPKHYCDMCILHLLVSPHQKKTPNCCSRITYYFFLWRHICNLPRGMFGQPSIRLLCRIFFRQIAILAATNPVKMALVRWPRYWCHRSTRIRASANGRSSGVDEIEIMVGIIFGSRVGDGG